MIRVFSRNPLRDKFTVSMFSVKTFACVPSKSSKNSCNKKPSYLCYYCAVQILLSQQNKNIIWLVRETGNAN